MNYVTTTDRHQNADTGGLFNLTAPSTRNMLRANLKLLSSNTKYNINKMDNGKKWNAHVKQTTINPGTFK